MRKKLLFTVLLILSQISYGQNAADDDTSFNNVLVTGSGFNSYVNSIVVSVGRINFG